VAPLLRRRGIEAMGNLNLNNAADFATATMGNVSGVLQTLSLAGRDPSQWDIVEASYNGVLIHVFTSQTNYNAALPQVSDKGGRRKVRYQFPYQDGQTTDDLGRKPETFEMDILLFGQNYSQALAKLFAEFNKPTPGTLVHPVRGNLTVVVTDYELIHSHEKRKAVEIRVTFEEHNFTIGSFLQQQDKSVKGLLSAALSAFQAIQNVINAVSGVTKFVRSVVNQINQGLADYQTGYASLMGQMNTTFNGGSAADIPALLPVNQGGTLNSSTGTQTSSTFPTVQSATTLIAPPGQITNVVSIPAGLSDQVAIALAVKNLQNQVNALRAQVMAIIDQLKALDGLLFYQNIIDLKNTAISLQNILEAGIASSHSQITNYTVPELMTIREAAFANGIPISRITDMILLNPDVPSYNFLPPGTILQVFTLV
jgi:prophage DNA circulation protein